jgi:glycosyltransferase involved in cell wall biosynthesis
MVGGGTETMTPSSRPKLSVTIITLNEEREIEACLEGVAWADEIVVVDSGSVDRTVEIAKKYTDKVIHHDWPGYAAQKNWAVDQATHDWILSVDADERVLPPLREEIEAALASGGPHAGYLIDRKNFFLGRWIRHGGWAPDMTIRLFDRKRGRFKAREVHEVVQVDGSAGVLKTPMEHYTYRSLAAYNDRVGRYAALAARELRKEGRRFHFWDLFLRPAWTMFRMYILKQGFRDGVYGLALAGLYGYYTFLKYAKLWEMEKG